MNILVRLSGLLFVGLGLVVGLFLEGATKAAGAAGPSPLEFLLAALAFALPSFGVALLWCGIRLFEGRPAGGEQAAAPSRRP
jgi:hypothetical protein